MNRDLTFNIVFVSGTVRSLGLAVLTLVEQSPYRYRLVANGLLEDEIEALHRLAASHERLESYVYPTKRPIAHGTLLSLLAWREQGEYLCFADSDIFATAPFGDLLEQRLDTCDVFTSCTHFVADPEDEVAGFGGRCVQTPSGIPLPATFFAVYKAAPLRQIMLETGVMFERCYDRSHVTPAVAAVLERAGWQGERVDTSKLLGVLLHERGHRVVHEELAPLLHIGGISWWLMKHPEPDARPFVWKDDSFAFLGRRADRKESREVVARYFSDYLRAKFGEAAPPVLKLGRGDLRDKVIAAMAAIDAAHARFAARAPG